MTHSLRARRGRGVELSGLSPALKPSCGTPDRASWRVGCQRRKPGGRLAGRHKSRQAGRKGRQAGRRAGSWAAHPERQLEMDSCSLSPWMRRASSTVSCAHTCGSEGCGAVWLSARAGGLQSCPLPSSRTGGRAPVHGRSRSRGAALAHGRGARVHRPACVAAWQEVVGAACVWLACLLALAVPSCKARQGWPSPAAHHVWVAAQGALAGQRRQVALVGGAHHQARDHVDGLAILRQRRLKDLRRSGGGRRGSGAGSGRGSGGGGAGRQHAVSAPSWPAGWPAGGAACTRPRGIDVEPPSAEPPLAPR